jgi:hypothetical protein
MILEPHIISSSTSFTIHITLFLCYFIFCSTVMAGYDKSKSLNEAKNWRRELATRVEPAVASAPRTHSGLKREDPASIKSSWQRIDEGENVAPHPYTATYSIGNDSSPPLKKSRRRCYTEEEKAQVAETRRRGACGKCRASRIKVRLSISWIC